MVPGEAVEPDSAGSDVRPVRSGRLVSDEEDYSVGTVDDVVWHLIPYTRRAMSDVPLFAACDVRTLISWKETSTFREHRIYCLGCILHYERRRIR